MGLVYIYIVRGKKQKRIYKVFVGVEWLMVPC